MRYELREKQLQADHDRTLRLRVKTFIFNDLF